MFTPAEKKTIYFAKMYTSDNNMIKN